VERHLEAHAALRTPPAEAERVLAAGPAALFGDHLTGGIFPLAVPLGTAGAVHHDVRLEVGELRTAEGEAWVPLRWVPVGHERLLPDFAGVLEVLDGGGDDDPPARLRLLGAYTVPLGAVGRFGDGVAGHRLARLTLATLVTELAARLDERANGTVGHAVGGRTIGS
jgi:hypothetical protein